MEGKVLQLYADFDVTLCQRRGAMVGLSRLQMMYRYSTEIRRDNRQSYKQTWTPSFIHYSRSTNASKNFKGVITLLLIDETSKITNNLTGTKWKS
jgi:hypothetical protein